LKAFQSVSEYVMRECCTIVVSKTFKKGDQLMALNERVLNIYVILEGKVKRTKPMPPSLLDKNPQRLGGMQETSLIGKSEVIGLQWVDDRTRFPSDSTFTCYTEEVQCLVLHAMDYKDILQRFQQREAPSNMAFLRKVRLFQEMSHEKLDDLCR
jgi:hypothetical protein